MKRIDGRKLSIEKLQHLRNTAIELYKLGKTYDESVEILGVSKTTIWKWRKIYKDNGSLTFKTRGVKAGERSKLLHRQSLILKHILIQNTPEQFDLNYSLWTRQAIKNLIKKQWNIKIHITTVGRYMKKLGFTPQKPIKRAYEQNPKVVKKWLKKTFSEIVDKSIKEGAEIHWLDETKLSSYSNDLKDYSPKGKTPVIRMKAKRMSMNIISSISKLGKMRFMIYESSLNIKTLIEFTKRLVKSISKKLFIVMDNLPLHHSHAFKNWLKDHRNFVEVFYLPPYSPELNPDERLNRDLKTHFHSGPSVKSKKEFKCKILSFMIKVQKRPIRVMNYFNSTHVKYAA